MPLTILSQGDTVRLANAEATLRAAGASATEAGRFAERAEEAAQDVEGVRVVVDNLPAILDAPNIAVEVAEDRQAAEAARDASIVSAQLYTTEPIGRAAVANGATFDVQGNGSDIASYRYRKVDANSSTLLATFPTAASVKAIPALTVPSQADLEQFEDEIGNLVRRTDANGDQFLPSMNQRSVQEANRDTRGNIRSGSSPVLGDTFSFEDAFGNVTMRQDKTGGVFIPGSKLSVQGMLGKAVSGSYRWPTDRDKLRPDIKAMMANLVAEGLDFIPPPNYLVPGNYEVPDSIISSFSCTPGVPLRLETPYGLGGNVHPNLMQPRKPIAGFRYLMSESPHKNGSSSEENPLLYGTNDLRNFHLIPNVTQPFETASQLRSNYFSDPYQTYDPRTGELYLIWREGGGPNGAVYHYSKTRNGADWTEPVLGPAVGASPSILYDPGLDIWHLFCEGSDGVAHLTGPTVMGPWVNKSASPTLARFGFKVWHLEVKYIGSKFFAMAHQVGATSQFFLGVSADGDNWTFGPGLVQPQTPYMYKGSFLPEFNGNQMRLWLAWNLYFDDHPEIPPDFQCVPTNWTTI